MSQCHHLPRTKISTKYWMFGERKLSTHQHFARLTLYISKHINYTQKLIRTQSTDKNKSSEDEQNY